MCDEPYVPFFNHLTIDNVSTRPQDRGPFAVLVLHEEKKYWDVMSDKYYQITHRYGPTMPSCFFR